MCGDCGGNGYLGAVFGACNYDGGLVAMKRGLKTNVECAVDLAFSACNCAGDVLDECGVWWFRHQTRAM